MPAPALPASSHVLRHSLCTQTPGHFLICRHSQVARSLGLTTGPVAVVVPLSTFGSWEREMAKWAVQCLAVSCRTVA